MITKKQIENVGLRAICENLYLLNKEAKAGRQEYYAIKDAVLHILVKRKIAIRKGWHIVGEYKHFNEFIGYTQTREIKAVLFEVIDETGKMWDFHSTQHNAVGDYLGDLRDTPRARAYSTEKIEAQGAPDTTLLTSLYQ